MKRLTVSEALIALGNGEKITADCMEEDYMFLEDNGIKLSDGAEYQGLLDLKYLYGKNLRIYQEFTYPMWFKNINISNTIKTSKFTGLTRRTDTDDGREFYDSTPHTDSESWQQVEEPKKKIKVAKYAYKTNTVSASRFIWVETEGFYGDDAHFTSNPSIDQLARDNFKRLDYTEIEVEDY